MYRLLVPQSNLQRVAGSATSKEEQKKRAAGATLRHISNFLYPGMAYPGKCDDPIFGDIFVFLDFWEKRLLLFDRNNITISYYY